MATKEGVVWILCWSHHPVLCLELCCAMRSVRESNKLIRRPEHHLQMMQYVVARYGSDALRDIHLRPDVTQEVSAADTALLFFKLTATVWFIYETWIG